MPDRSYDLFEKLPDQSVVWRGIVHGLQDAKLKLGELAAKTNNECFAMYLPTQEVVGRVNGTLGDPGGDGKAA